MEQADPASVVRAVQQRLEDAWRAGDGQAFAESCTQDADFVNLLGMYRHGRPAIAALHQSIFDGMYAASVMTLATERARFLSDDLILAQASTRVRIPAGPLQGEVRGLVTMVLARTGGEWLITSFQNTRKEGADPDQGARIKAAMDQT